MSKLGFIGFGIMEVSMTGHLIANVHKFFLMVSDAPNVVEVLFANDIAW